MPKYDYRNFVSHTKFMHVWTCRASPILRLLIAFFSLFLPHLIMTRACNTAFHFFHFPFFEDRLSCHFTVTWAANIFVKTVMYKRIPMFQWQLSVSQSMINLLNNVFLSVLKVSSTCLTLSSLFSFLSSTVSLLIVSTAVIVKKVKLLITSYKAPYCPTPKVIGLFLPYLFIILSSFSLSLT